uniref:Solute carrier family 22 member 11 n=1 Tax=Aotus nancymaae TaxID=37293 RepID=A0A2K5CH92_AOTNA
MEFSELLEQAGGAGLFQTLLLLTFILPCFMISFHVLLENFSASVPGHRCWTQLLDNGSVVPANITPEALLTISIPPGPNWEPDQCRRFRQPQWQLVDPNATTSSWNEADTEPCVDGWVYDRSTFTSTIVMKWDLVCSSQGLKPLSQSIFMSGILVGSFIWGLLSHRLGRKPMLSWSCLQTAVAGTGTTFAPTLLIYCGLRFVTAFGIAGIFLSALGLMVEWTTTSRRAVTLTVLACSSSAGQAALGGVAFALRDWQTLQLAVSVPFFAIFLISWMTAEGLMQVVGRLGGMMSPLILMSRQALPLLPPLFYGVISIASSLVVLFFLPETRGLPLPDTVQDLESQKSTAAQGNRQEAVAVESTWF